MIGLNLNKVQKKKQKKFIRESAFKSGVWCLTGVFGDFLGICMGFV